VNFKPRNRSLGAYTICKSVRLSPTSGPPADEQLNASGRQLFPLRDHAGNHATLAGLHTHTQLRLVVAACILAGAGVWAEEAPIAIRCGVNIGLDSRRSGLEQIGRPPTEAAFRSAVRSQGESRLNKQARVNNPQGAMMQEHNIELPIVNFTVSGDRNEITGNEKA
jgi:hypothetical protein